MGWLNIITLIYLLIKQVFHKELKSTQRPNQVIPMLGSYSGLVIEPHGEIRGKFAAAYRQESFQVIGSMAH
jgi:hypothetical protein